jgi:hypothetical protein
LLGGAEREGNLKSRMCHRASARTPVEHGGLWRTASDGDPYGVVLEFKFPSRIIASKQSMTDLRRARRGPCDSGRPGEPNQIRKICMCPRKAESRRGQTKPRRW